MVILNSLYYLFIYPLYTIMEVIFLIFYAITHNYGISIIGVSIAVTVLTLPLYLIAEKLQNEERNIQKKLKPKIDKIKAVFSGDEQYFILSTYYRQNKYHPLYSLRSSLGLLIQIPFFIAAYNFLSNYSGFDGASFFIIKNLKEPDALLKIGALSINILPILMTVLNIISAAIYTRGFTVKEKIQLYGMAGLFLILLYNSPSALLVYWTLNNLFALVKNLVLKTKHPVKIVAIATNTMALMLLIIYNFFMELPPKKIIFISLFCFAIFIITICTLLKRVLPLKKINMNLQKEINTPAFIWACFLLATLCGLFIPVSVIASSPQEFSFMDQYQSPLQLLPFPLLQATGFFVILPIFIFYLNKKTQPLFFLLIVWMTIYALINYFIFPVRAGTLSQTLLFTDYSRLQPEKTTALINIFLALILLVCIFIITIKKRAAIFAKIFPVVFLALIITSGYNIIQIQKSFSQLSLIKDNEKTTTTTVEPLFAFSPTKKNVLLIMLDTAISSFVPVMFEEKPILKQQFSGFTFYPNTASYNGHTILAAPPLFGGYEYSPEEMNERSNEPLVKKHNEALSVLPVLFSQQDFSVSVADAPLTNYSWIFDQRVFSEYKKINALSLNAKYTEKYLIEKNIQLPYVASQLLQHNFLFFSFLNIFPPSLRLTIYFNERYWNSAYKPNQVKGFVDVYAPFYYLPELTTTQAQPAFISITSDITHAVLLLEKPDYTPSQNPISQGDPKYDVNMAAFLLLGRYFDYLKQLGVYDNTRIIIVSDHGPTSANLPVFSNFKDESIFYNSYNALLLFKDFDSKNTLTTNNHFMSNADVPYLATNNLMQDAKNPFTGKKFRLNNGTVVANITHKFNPENHNKNTFNLEEKLIIKDNIFVESNWHKENP